MKNMFTGLAVAGLLAASAAQAQDAVEIVYIPKNTGNAYFDGIVQGFAETCDKIGCDFTTVAPADAGATSQIPFLNAQIQRGVDVIAITPNSPDALNRIFARARDRGIEVLVVNSDITGFEDQRDAAIMPVDFSNVGRDQIALMGRLIDYKGQFAILSATTDAPDQNRFIAGMQETLESDDRYSEMELVTIVYGDDDPQKSTTETEVLLSNYPDLKGIIAPTTVGVAAAAQVVEGQGKADEVAVTGLGTPNQMRRFIENGTVEAFQLWAPDEQGRAAAYLGVALSNGTLKGEVGETFEAGDLGTLEIRENRIVLPREGLTTFDADNIANYDF
ncbi:substrate-binding domain-containing protein [Oceaniglobus trochenteri]|uniref:substrate-binding domain-containing protein n=1 Tax=Oceaniglobus trochenteri TaxID=2763260 RepID=UPI001CFF9C7C|nr:substrate-binding domain-containing protein [Oceaniglobus trochenteri]